ncbi:hypothetical protein JOF56_000147 [Kibdelosporangium banguiense]|uniref:Uncharacterized protein n=1 Tax=Kibdelosporangium banguiense TaxID=1365924 RepID=A0ABS4T5L7_9PSEU|nr:hypothetical protein [Kibdelosporangium banguiense]MBP2319762.1 hypothetical protein [Kibdelosporangium banguiense]
MSAHRFRRVNRRTAEQMLDGAPDRVRTDGSDALNGLLAAASAPARLGELAGEEAAVAAFRAARLADAGQPRRQSMLKVALAKMLTVKIAATVVATLAVGGVAVAAVTGSLPNQDPTPAPPVPPSTWTDTVPGNSSGGVPGGAPNATGKNDKDKNTQPDKPNGDQNPAPSPSFDGLCNALTAGNKADHGKALENPAFTELIKQAGGKDKVLAFCVDLNDKQRGKSGNAPGNGGANPGNNGNGPDKNPKEPNGNQPAERPNR